MRYDVIVMGLQKSDAARTHGLDDVSLPPEHQKAVEALPEDLVPRLFQMLDEQKAARVNRETRRHTEALLKMERFGC
jgi:hypothetical protein